LSDIENRRL